MSYEDQSHRFVITGKDPEGHPRTIILWRETDLVDGKVVRRVHVTLDATTVTETILTGGRPSTWLKQSWRLPSEPPRAVGAVPAGSPSTPAAGRGVHPKGVLKARCGHLLPVMAMRFAEVSARKCTDCHLISLSDAILSLRVDDAGAAVSDGG
jgi:hypothetical protein